MSSKNSNDLIINKCLIIDNRIDEVNDIILKLNEKSISTDYRKDVLERNVFIDPNTQLVILDLFLNDEDQGRYDSAIDTVHFLNEKINGPYFLLIWTKRKELFEEFKEKLEGEVISINNDSDKSINFPLDIIRLDFNKVAGSQNEETVEKVIECIRDYIKNIEEKYINIYSYMKLTKIFQEQSSIFWDILRPKNFADNLTYDSFSTKYNEALGAAFDSFDKAFNYEKSGKGFLDIYARFLENELTLNHLDYNSNSNVLDYEVKEEINAKLITHSFDYNKPKNGMPGLIYKLDYLDDKLLEELNYSYIENYTKFTKEFFKLSCLWGKLGKKPSNFSYKELIEIRVNDENIDIVREYFGNNIEYETNEKLSSIITKQLLSSVKVGRLIITPYCDFAHEKKLDVLYLEILILSDFNRRKEDVNRMLKPNVNLINLHNGKFIMYIPSQYKLCELKDIGKELYKFYISKEYVNEIQINIANSISRIGTTIIE